jgi:hypothetical protein
MNDARCANILIIDLTGDDDTASIDHYTTVHRTGIKRARPSEFETDTNQPVVKKQQVDTRQQDDEKRLKRFRSKPTNEYNQLRYRALTQRMFVLDRKREDTGDGYPIETVTLAGSTGNVYTIIIDKIPTCNCPHARKGNQQCKHTIYVLSRVLKVRPELEYQLAFCSFELREIFENAPLLPAQQVEGSSDGNRKPTDGECPICCDELVSEGFNEELVYCKASCGNNLHKSCFKQWAATKGGQSVTCPFCRQIWEHDDEDLDSLLQGGPVNFEGYKNVAGRLGMSGIRDTSTYSSWPSRGSWQTSYSKHMSRWNNRHW